MECNQLIINNSIKKENHFRVTRKIVLCNNSKCLYKNFEPRTTRNTSITIERSTRSEAVRCAVGVEVAQCAVEFSTTRTHSPLHALLRFSIFLRAADPKACGRGRIPRASKQQKNSLLEKHLNCLRTIRLFFTFYSKVENILLNFQSLFSQIVENNFFFGRKNKIRFYYPRIFAAPEEPVQAVGCLQRYNSQPFTQKTNLSHVAQRGQRSPLLRLFVHKYCPATYQYLGHKQYKRFYESSVWKNINTSAPYMEDDNESICSEEEGDTDIEIVPHHDTQFKHTFYVPKIFYSHIIGAKGLTLKKLENETKATIEIPKKGKDGNIVIIARDRKTVSSARHRIDLLIEASKKKINFTHFLSIPLNKENIINKFNLFKNDVLRRYDKTTYNIDETLFQTPCKLHLTIGVLKLFDDNDKEHAINALKRCKEDIIDPIIKESGPINIQLQGVACMNDDPTEVKVLFAQVIPNEKLQEIVDKISNYFDDIGLKKKDYERVKLHATLMNMLFKDDYRARFKEKFDASEILKIYKDASFGETKLEQIDISERHTAVKDSYYKSLSSIAI